MKIRKDVVAPVSILIGGRVIIHNGFLERYGNH